MFEIIKKYNFWDKKEIKYGFIRKNYINKIEPYINNPLIKVITGQRRVGKSYLLRMIINQIINRGLPPENILYINKEMSELEFISNKDELWNVIQEYRKIIKPEGKIYIFLDEIQEIEGWEKIVNSLSQDYVDEYEVFITGSNANLLSTELSTYLSGRYISIEVFPFSYSEFSEFNQCDKNKESFTDYLKTGGMPEILNFDDSEIITNYIMNLIDSIILRDIVQRHNIRDVNLLGKLLYYLTDSIGNLFSVNSIVNYLKSSNYTTNNETLGCYIQYLTESYIIHEVPRYDIKGKRLLSSEKKYYLNDTGFKYHLASSFDFGIGKYLENIIFLDLKRKGYKVYTGNIMNCEIDFIAEKGSDKTYIQAAYLLADESVIEREFGNLEKINDNYEKKVISMDDFTLGNRSGIHHVSAWEFVD